ncbi:MAG TPA: class I SAM-dependent methyltransferase, partial [Candidatus Sulfotelmatobacter sp.]|nr:class I SAM-dependent methyltransferase [Candidatus Sulfotelmatobacter sp.]
IERAEPALRQARRNLDGLVAHACFLQGDMAERMRGTFDVVLAGYTLHHLQLEAKRRIFGEFSQVLVPGGIAIVYDLVQGPAESREAYLNRALTYSEARWQAFSREELDRIRGHVTQYDYPESWTTWKSLARENGFRRASMTFFDPARLFGFMEFHSCGTATGCRRRRR